MKADGRQQRRQRVENGKRKMQQKIPTFKKTLSVCGKITDFEQVELAIF